MTKSIFISIALLSSPLFASEINCQNPRNTMEVNECKRITLENADAEMARYLNKSVERYSDDPEIVDAIKTGQSAWESYANKHCNSVFTKWRGGTIRTVMALDCKIRVTKQRTHQLWLDYLNYMDSTRPDLPEPTRPQAY